MDPCKALPLLPIEHVIRCQHQKHVGRRTASQYILPLLPQVGKILQLREVGANQPRPRGHSSWNIGPIGAAEAVSNRHRASSHARRNEAVFSPGCTPRTKVQSIEHVVRADNFGKNSMEKILLHAEALHIPPGATDDKSTLPRFEPRLRSVEIVADKSFFLGYVRGGQECRSARVSHTVTNRNALSPPTSITSWVVR